LIVQIVVVSVFIVLVCESSGVGSISSFSLSFALFEEEYNVPNQEDDLYWQERQERQEIPLEQIIVQTHDDLSQL
jgi:hypothetical protein